MLLRLRPALRSTQRVSLGTATIRLTQQASTLAPPYKHGAVPRCLPPRPTRTPTPFAYRSLHASAVAPSPPEPQRDRHRPRRPYLLADVGEGITECEIVKWHVQAGAQVQEFDPLCEVQSDKASVEITSRYDGIVQDLAGKVGDIVRVGQPLCFIEMEVEAGDEAGLEGGESRETVPDQDASLPPRGPEGDEALAEKLQSPPAPTPTPTPTPESASPPPPPATPARRPHPLDPNAQQPPPSPSSMVLATPAVRRLCREQNLDLSLIGGTGRDGRVTKEDVHRFLQAGPQQASTPSSTFATQAPTPASVAGEPQPLTGLRKAMFKSLGLSVYIPHFTFSEELDVTELESLRARINASLSAAHAKPNPLSRSVSGGTRPPLTKLTLFPFLVKALSLTLPSHPLFLSKLSLPPNWHTLPLAEQAAHARLGGPRASHDVGYALSTPNGLVTPVLRSAERKSVLDIGGEIAAVGERARGGAGAGGPLGPDDFAMASGGSTILLSNIGSIGAGTAASPVLPPTGELAIGAVCAVKQQWVRRVAPVAQGQGQAQGQAQPQGQDGEWRSVVPVTFAGDHRVLQGTELAALVKEWKWWVENPAAWVAVGGGGGGGGGGPTT